jgi:HD-GYP domain-containing protein (c-di-GMP phosphodiesterase class II)/DNA-binding CsgD family transcriptional regulator
MTENRLASVLGALSRATDLAAGQPPGAALAATVLAVRLGRRMGLPEPDLCALYYAGVTRFIGCTSTSEDIATQMLGDELTPYLALSRADPADPESVRRELESLFAPDAPTEARRKIIEALVGMGSDIMLGGVTHCEQAISLTRRLPVPEAVPTILARLESRWDDRHPTHPAGPELLPATRIIECCVVVELHRRAGGLRSMVEVARSRAGGQFDPEVVSELLADPVGLTSGLTPAREWQTFLDCEPGTPAQIGAHGLRQTAEAFADFTDHKSRFFVGHSRQVASLALRAAVAQGGDEGWCRALHDAALLHDIGKCAIPNGIWNKSSALDPFERSQAQTHAFHTEQILAISPGFEALGEIACSAHERRDGSGYHRRTRLEEPRAAILAAANLYDELTSDAPTREALAPDEAAEVSAGRLPHGETRSVLEAAGRRAAATRVYPDGITPREAEVLRHLTRGLTNKRIASKLGIAPKTVDNHLQNLYTKIGTRTRTAATLYAFDKGIFSD